MGFQTANKHSLMFQKKKKKKKKRKLTDYQRCCYRGSPRCFRMLIQRINLDFHLFSPLAKTRRHMKFAEKQLRNDGDAKNLQRIILTIENCQFSFGGYDGCNF